METYNGNTIRYWHDKAKSYGKYVDDLRCCGNCEHWRHESVEKEFKECDEDIDYCKNWQFDGMTQKDREVE